MKWNVTKENFMNFVTRALNGEYDREDGEWDEHAVGNQLILLAKGRAYPSVEGKRVRLVDDAAPGGAVPPVDAGVGACSQRRRHNVFKRKGETCGECGYPEPPTTGATTNEEAEA